MKLLRALLVTIIVIGVFMAGYYRFWVLRLPDRNTPYNEKVFISPGNGTIASVKQRSSNSLLVTKGDDGAINVWTKDVDTAGTIISIQMDLSNVHYQRAPASGKILAE